MRHEVSALPVRAEKSVAFSGRGAHALYQMDADTAKSDGGVIALPCRSATQIEMGATDSHQINGWEGVLGA